MTCKGISIAANAGTADISMPNDKAELNKIFQGSNTPIPFTFIYMCCMLTGRCFRSELGHKRLKS